MGDTVYEGTWDCSNCGKTRIRASHTTCPRCEDPQNSVLSPAEDWYLPAEATTITDPEELSKAHLPSWNCGHCGTLNTGDLTSCSHCSRPLDFDDTVNRRTTYDDLAQRFDTKPDPRDEMIESDWEQADRTMRTGPHSPRTMQDLTLSASALPTIGQDTEFYEKIRDDADRRFEERQTTSLLSPFAQKLYLHRNRIIYAVAAVAVLALVVGVILGVVRAVRYYTTTVPGTVTVSELHWERKVEIEVYKGFTESDWSLPDGAQVIGRERKIRSYRTVHDGWRTEPYTDYETHYRPESRTENETRYKNEPYSYDCSYTVNNGNGKFTKVSRSCSGTRQVSYQVQVQKTVQVPYQVPVPKTRDVEVTHQEPVYDTWYTYQVNRWTTERWVSASDATSGMPIWPEPTGLSNNDQSGDQVGEERLGDERTASYTIVYIDAKGVTRSEQSDDDGVWHKLSRGETVPARYRERNGELDTVEWQAAA